MLQSNCTAESAQLFVNCLEAMVETCLPVDEPEILSTEIPSEKFKRSDGHYSDIAQRSKSSTHGTDRSSTRIFSDRMDEASHNASFVHRE